MDIVRATDLIGMSATPDNLRKMVKALNLHSWNNTVEEKARLEAAKFILKFGEAYRNECAARRDARNRRR